MSDHSDDMEMYSGFVEDYYMMNNVFDDILNYCEPHIDQMWAATIVGMILNCDFRDAKQTLKEYREDDYE